MGQPLIHRAGGVTVLGKGTEVQEVLQKMNIFWHIVPAQRSEQGKDFLLQHISKQGVLKKVPCNRISSVFGCFQQGTGVKLLPSPAAEQKSASAQLQQRVEAAAGCHQGEDFRRLALACERALLARLWFVMRVPIHPSFVPVRTRTHLCTPLPALQNSCPCGRAFPSCRCVYLVLSGWRRVPGAGSWGLGEGAGLGTAPSQLFLGARGAQGLHAAEM